MTSVMTPVPCVGYALAKISAHARRGIKERVLYPGSAPNATDRRYPVTRRAVCLGPHESGNVLEHKGDFKEWQTFSFNAYGVSAPSVAVSLPS